MSNSSITDDKLDAARLELLRLLEQQPELSQRQLSQALGLSLGKTHYLLHALLDKGLLKIRNFQRSDRKLAYAYVLTPSGLREKLRLTRDFLARKENEFAALRRTIATLRQDVSAADARGALSTRQGGKP
jgi:EPS-associated MarR family transcriptional regulator